MHETETGEYAALPMPRRPVFLGGEDRTRYQRNREIYLKSHSAAGENRPNAPRGTMRRWIGPVVTVISTAIWFFFLLLFIGIAHADPVGAPYTGRVQALLHDVIGCESLQILVNLQVYHARGDRDEYNKWAGLYLSKGQCGMFYAGQAVYVINYGGPDSTFTWIQPVGGLTRIWVPFDAVLSRF